MKEVKIERYESRPNPKVSICIPLYEKDKWYEQAIRSIKEHDAGMPYEIVTSICKQGVALNRNAAQRAAKCNIICQFDGDADIIQDGWLKILYDTLMSDEKIGMVGAIIVFPNGTVDYCGTILKVNVPYANKKMDFIFSNSLKQANEEGKKAIRKQISFMKQRIEGRISWPIDYNLNKEKIDNKVFSVFQCGGVCFIYDRRRQGEFGEAEYLTCGWDDTDFMLQAHQRGYLIVINGKVKIKHPNHVRSKKEIDERVMDGGPRSFRGYNLVKSMLKWGYM